MAVERYRATMTGDVLHSWAVDAQAEIDSLRAALADAHASRSLGEQVAEQWAIYFDGTGTPYDSGFQLPLKMFQSEAACGDYLQSCHQGGPGKYEARKIFIFAERTVN